MQPNCIDFLRRFKPIDTSAKKRPVGRPKKKPVDQPEINQNLPIDPATTNDSETNEDLEQPPKKRHGQYRLHYLQFKKIAMNELHELGSQVGEVAEKFNIPRSNLFTWEKQLS